VIVWPLCKQSWVLAVKINRMWRLNDRLTNNIMSALKKITVQWNILCEAPEKPANSTLLMHWSCLTFTLVPVYICSSICPKNEMLTSAVLEHYVNAFTFVGNQVTGKIQSKSLMISVLLSMYTKIVLSPCLFQLEHKMPDHLDCISLSMLM